jgi:hypothetical protein
VAESIRLRVDDDGQCSRLAGAFRAAASDGRGLREDLRREIREASSDVVTDLRAAVLGLHITGEGRRVPRSVATARPGPPLRASVADAVRLRTSLAGRSPGVRIDVDSSRLPAELANMPSRLDEGRWRHPVYGNRESWTTEYAAPGGWWFNTLQRHLPRWRRAVEDAMRAVDARLR